MMKPIEHIPCCVCGESAVERSFDGTGWCQIHFEDWKAFLHWNRKEFNGLSDAFDAWLKAARTIHIAPELLEALEVALPFLAEMAAFLDREMADWAAKVYRRVLAAIAKARGTAKGDET